MQYGPHLHQPMPWSTYSLQPQVHRAGQDLLLVHITATRLPLLSLPPGAEACLQPLRLLLVPLLQQLACHTTAPHWLLLPGHQLSCWPSLQPPAAAPPPPPAAPFQNCCLSSQHTHVTRSLTGPHFTPSRAGCTGALPPAPPCPQSPSPAAGTLSPPLHALLLPAPPAPPPCRPLQAPRSLLCPAPHTR